MLNKRTLPLAVLVLAVLLVYANSFCNAFHFDDFHTVTDNPAVRSLGNLPRIFTDTTAFSVLPANQTYRPLVTASLALDYALGHGYVPFWFHLSTVLWFEVLVVVLYLFVQGLLDRVRPAAANRWLALVVASWFGLHPAMAETVNYVIQRGDLYCTLGCVAALLIYARFPDLRRYGVYLLPYVAAMLSKPPAAIFPALLLLFVFFFDNVQVPAGRRWRLALTASLPAVALTAILLWLQSAMTPKTFRPSILSPADYRLAQPYVWLRYTSALFLPVHLNVDTDLQPFPHLNSKAMLGILFVGLILGLALWSAQRKRLYPIAFGLLWFVLTQLPTSLYPLSEVENDHRMFFSFPGLMLAFVWALYLLYERVTLSGDERGSRSRVLQPAVVAIILVCLSGYAYGAHRRNQVWRTEDSLWADDALKSPHNGRGLMIYGLTRLNVGKYPEALDLFQRALVYTPNYATLEINLGVVNGLLAAQGRPDLVAVAEGHFRRAVALSPADDTTHGYYGRWLMSQGRVPEAKEQLQIAVAANPQRQMQRDLLITAYEQSGDRNAAMQLAKTTLELIPGDQAALNAVAGRSIAEKPSAAASLINLSLNAYRAGQFQKAMETAKKALVVDPGSAEAWNNLGAAYGGLKEWDLAIAAETQALKLNPALQIARNNLNWFNTEKFSPGKSRGDSGGQSADDYVNLSLALNQQGRYDASIAAAQQALKLKASSAEAWNNISADQAAMHHWPQAVDAARQAIALRPDFQLARNNLAWALQQQATSAAH